MSCPAANPGTRHPRIRPQSQYGSIGRVLLVMTFVMTRLSLFGGEPTLDALYPPGIAPGTTNEITLTGKFDPWPPKFWISSALANRTQHWSRSGPCASALDVTISTGTNKARVSFAVASHAPPGPRLLRIYNDEGVSDPRIFVIGAGKEILEAEDNNHFAKAQRMDALPATINGLLAKGGDVDSFAVHVPSGRWLEARVDSHVLMSKLDAVIRLVNRDGLQLDWNHDFTSMDPRILWRADTDADVVVQVYGFPHPATSAVTLYGGDSAIYRLHLQLHPHRPAPVTRALLPTPDVKTLPLSLCRTILSGDEEDRFQFKASKDDVIEAQVIAAATGSPLDAWLRIEDAEGKQLARNDDAENSRDPVLEWKAPNDATYTVAIGSLTHRGGEDFHYRLELNRVSPDYRASLSSSALSIKAGATNALKFKVERLRGHTNELTARLGGLPEGVSALATNLPAKGGDFEISIVASTNAAPFSGPIHLYVLDQNSREERLIEHALTSRSIDNGVPQGYLTLLVESIDHCWLTVRREKEKAEDAEQAGKKS